MMKYLPDCITQSRIVRQTDQSDSNPSSWTCSNKVFRIGSYPLYIHRIFFKRPARIHDLFIATKIDVITPVDFLFTGVFTRKNLLYNFSYCIEPKAKLLQYISVKEDGIRDTGFPMPWQL